MRDQPGGSAFLIFIGACVVVGAIALGYRINSAEWPWENALNIVAPEPGESEVADSGEPQPDSTVEEIQPLPDESVATLEGINQVRVRPDGSAVVAGLASPGSAINLMNGGKVIGSGLASEKGEWVIVLDPPLDSGSHLLSVEIITPGGETIVGGLAAAVELTGERDAKPLVALVPYTADALDRGTPPKILQAPGANASKQPAGPGVNIRSIQPLREGRRIQIAGNAWGGAAVSLGVNGRTVSEVAVSGNTYVTETDIDPGANRFRLKVTLLDGSGKAIASARINLQRSKIQQALGNSLVVIQKGDALWRIAYRTYGHGIRYVDIYARNSDQISNPDLIYPDQIFVVPNP